jgi:hypothetical protein
VGALCIGCGRVVDGCLGILDACRYRRLLVAARRLLVSGTDPTKSLKNRQRQRCRARKQLREVLDAVDPQGAEAAARASWPRWAQEVEAAISGVA